MYDQGFTACSKLYFWPRMKKGLIPQVFSETGRLRIVVLGRADDMGPIPSLEDSYDAKSRESVELGIYPKEEALIEEMEGFAQVLEKHDVEVFRPSDIKGLNQVFARDISFAIEDQFITPNIIEDREEEIGGIKHVQDRIDPDHIIEFKDGVYAEGGDCIPWRDHIFVGYSKNPDFTKYETARTNEKAIYRLQEIFPELKVHGFELVKSDLDPRKGSLHLDCCFQPIGRNEAIIYEAGFKHQHDVDYIKELYGDENLIKVDREEFYQMFPNVFSISEDVVVSNHSFTRLNEELENRGYTVEKIQYDEVAKMGGLLRCSTMPIYRDR